MSAIRLRVAGLEAARNDIRQFDEKLRRRFVRDALRNAMTLMRRAIIAAAPRQTPAPRDRRTTRAGLPLGPIRRAMTTIAPPPRGDTVRVVIRSRSKRVDAFYAKFIEEGFTHRGGTRVAARPFAKPAAAASYPATMDRFRELLAARIQREVARRRAR